MTDERTTTKAQEDAAAKGSSVSVRNLKDRTPMESQAREFFWLAQRCIEANAVPASFKNKDGEANASALMIAMMHGHEVGLKPLAAIQRIYVVNGIPTLYGDAVKAIVEASGQLEDMQETVDGDGDDMMATCKVKRRNRSWITQFFGVVDAKAAGLWGKPGPWKLYRRRMLQMRARNLGLRDAFPDVLSGLDLGDLNQGDPTPLEAGADGVMTPSAPRPRREPTGDNDKTATDPDGPNPDDNEYVFPLYDGDGIEVGLLTADEWKSRYNDLGLSMMNSPNFQKWQDLNAEAFTAIYGKPQPNIGRDADQQGLGV